jgi:hypothetical protein
MSRRLLAPLAAVGVAVAAAAGLSTGGGDALAATVATVALALAVFSALAASGGAAAPGPGEATLAIAIFGVAFGQRRLGLPLGDELAAAALFALLGVGAWRAALALRRRVTAPRFPWELAALPLVVYLAVLPWAEAHRPPDGDEPYNLLLVQSLAADFDTDLANQYAEGAWRGFSPRPIEPQPGDPRGAHGEIWSRHNALLPLLLVPAWKLGGLAGVEIEMAAMAALLAGFVASLLRRHFPDRPDAVFRAWALAAFAPPLLLYSAQVWIEVPAALAATVALDRLAALERRSSRRDFAILALALVALPLLKLRLGLVAIAVAALAARPGRLSRRVVVGLGAALALALGALAAWNFARFGNPLKIYGAGELSLIRQSPAGFGLAFLGLFFDSAFGLVAASPVWLLLVPAVGRAFADPRAPRWTLAAGLPYLTMVLSRHEWYGGWSPPFRYGVVLLPFLALAIATLLADRRRRAGAAQRFLVAGLAAATALLALVWLVAPGWTYNLADGSSWWLDLISERAGADVGRFAPSSVRPRLATAIVPLASAALALALWFAPRLRPRGGTRAAAVAALCGGVALFTWAARTLPTRIVEFEDGWVAKSGGTLFPDRWTVDRTRFRGGWLLYEGSSLAFRPVAGGRQARLRIASQYLRNNDSPLALAVRVGDAEVARFPAERPGAWSEIELGPLAIPRGATITLAAVGPPGAPPANGLVLDRAEITWQ